MKKLLYFIVVIVFSATAYAADYADDQKVDGLDAHGGSVASTSKALVQDPDDTDKVATATFAEIVNSVLSAFAETLADDDNATEARGTLGLGAAATLGAGTLTDTYVCVYSTASGLVCNTDPATLGGGFDNLTDFDTQTAYRIFYSDANGDVTELALGADGEYLKSNGASAAPSWATPSGAAHDAVTLSTDLGNNLLGLSTQQITLDNQTANYIFAGPATGGAAAPTFRAMVDADIPSAVARDTELHAAVTLGSGIGGLTLSTQELSLSARLEAYHDFTDPNADRIWFWDDSAGAFAGLAPGNSVAITTTTIDTIQDIRTTATPQWARIGIGQAADGTNPIASSGFSVDPDGDVTGKSFTASKSSGVAGDFAAYEANSTDTHAAGFRGPASITGDGAYRGQLANARATSANMVQAWTNVGETGTGTAADPYVQAISWVDLDNYLLTSSLGSNVLTFLQGPTLANLLSAVTGEGAFAATLLGYADGPATFTGIKQAASDTATGVVELATTAETSTGTDTARAVTPDGLSQSVYGQKEIGWMIHANAADTAVADGTQSAVIPASMNGMNLIDLTCSVANLNGAASGTTTVVLRRVRGATAADMTSTGVTIAYNEYTASDETVDTASDDVATGDKIYVDINAVTTAVQKGLSCTAVFQTP